MWLVNYVGMLLVVCQLSRNGIGYEDSQSVIGASRYVLTQLNSRLLLHVVKLSVLGSFSRS